MHVNVGEESTCSMYVNVGGESTCSMHVNVGQESTCSMLQTPACHTCQSSGFHDV